MIRSAAAIVSALALAAGCAGDDAGADTGVLRVFAASSLTEAFEEAGAAFEEARPEVSLQFTFGGSGALARQIADGAQADVFAAADDAAMASAADDVEDAIVFARNRLTIVVEAGNPKKIASLDDLAGDVIVVLCSPEVPCGRYAVEALRSAEVSVMPASLEENVKAVVAKVSLGEADAGIVYATDALAASERVDAVGVKADASLSASYPIAVIKTTRNRTLAEEWVRFLRSHEGQEILSYHGFLAP